jgi:hypothetical protein
MDDEAQAVGGLMDALLPGGGAFPRAGDTGMGALLLARLAAADATLPARIAAAVQTAGGSSPGQNAAECAARIEAAEPKLFAEFRKYAYLTYYEQPAVIDAIRALGFSYNDSPLPDGYAPDPFEAPRDAPRHGRGHWIRTEDVQPVGVAALRLEESAP